MLHLKVPTGLAWLDLPHGVRVQVRPPTTAIVARAQAASKRLIGGLLDDIARHKEAGESVDLPDLADPDVRTGMADLFTCIGFARAAIVAWEGVAAADSDEPAPVNPTTVGDLMRIHPIGDKFLDLYLAPLDALAAEGNASRPAPNGTGGTGPATAPAAKPATPAAPMDASAKTESAAPTSSTLP